MKHPYYNYDSAKALSLARNLAHGPVVPDETPLPTTEEALRIIEAEVATIGFNWITGKVACECLRADLGHKDPFHATP